MSEGNNKYEKGDKIIYDCGSWTIMVKFLGYSQLDSDCFIGEDETGDVSDDWLLSEIVGD